MEHLANKITQEFSALVDQIPQIGFEKHYAALLAHAQKNSCRIKKSIRDLPLPQSRKASSAIVISAGPSLRRRNVLQQIVEAAYQGTLVAVDGAYIACLKAGLIPDYVLTLDPHPTRTVRWFGDPEFEKHSVDDDYFSRQDLDVDFHKHSIEHNMQNIKLVDQYAPLRKAVVSSCSPENLVRRIEAASLDTYWFNPLVDNPEELDSLTRQLYKMNHLPCLNTGGTVGTLAWVFASTVLAIPEIALVGMDFGYYRDTPIEQTQTYYELRARQGDKKNVDRYFVEFVFPPTGERFYTDPTYFWYRKNFLELLKQAKKTVTYNCTEAGTLEDDEVQCMKLKDFLKKQAGQAD